MSKLARIHGSWRIVGLAGLAGLVGISTVDGAILDRDFQANPIGANVLGPTDGQQITGTPSPTVTVVSGADDVFGGGSNKSLKIDSPNTGSFVYYSVNDVDINQGIDGLGEFSVKMYHTESTGDPPRPAGPITQFVLGAKDLGFISSENVGIHILVFDNRSVRVRTAGGDVITDQIISFGQIHEIVFHFDVANSTFSFEIDNETVTIGGGANSVFPFLNSVPSINAFELRTPTTSRAGTVYLDDIFMSQVPEPATMMLLGLGVTVLLSHKRFE